MTVGRLAERMALPQPNVSQHLALVRVAGLVEAERDGREIRYRLADLSTRPVGVPIPAAAGDR